MLILRTNCFAGFQADPLSCATCGSRNSRWQQGTEELIFSSVFCQVNFPQYDEYEYVLAGGAYSLFSCFLLFKPLCTFFGCMSFALDAKLDSAWSRTKD